MTVSKHPAITGPTRPQVACRAAGFARAAKFRSQDQHLNEQNMPPGKKTRKGQFRRDIRTEFWRSDVPNRKQPANCQQSQTITRRPRRHRTAGHESSLNPGGPAAEAPDEHHQCRPEIDRNLSSGDPFGLACHLDFARRRAWRSRLPWKHSDSIEPFNDPRNCPDARRPQHAQATRPCAQSKIYENSMHPECRACQDQPSRTPQDFAQSPDF